MKLSSMIVSLAVIAACGKVNNTDGRAGKDLPVDESSQLGESVSPVVSDSVADETVASQVDDLATVIAEDADLDASDEVFGLHGGSGGKKHVKIGVKNSDRTKVRTCEQTPAGGAVVKKVDNKSKEFEIKQKDKVVTLVVARVNELTRTYEKGAASPALTCASNKCVDIDWQDLMVVEGLKETKEFTKSYSRMVSEKDAAGNVVSTNGRSSGTKGKRTVQFGKPTTADGKTTLEKTISGTIEKTLSLTEAGKKVDASHKTEIKVPVKVAVVRNANSGAWLTKTISGTLVSTHKDGAKVESTLEGLQFERGTCVPVAGVIKGQVFAKDAATASKTFELKFDKAAAGSGVVMVKKGRSEDFPKFLLGVRGCDLEAK